MDAMTYQFNIIYLALLLFLDKIINCFSNSLNEILILGGFLFLQFAAVKLAYKLL